MGVEVLKDRYDRLCRESVDMHEHMPTFVKTVEELDATTAIELGVRYGHSTIALLYGLLNRGHLWSVDCSFPVPANPRARNGLDDVNLLDPQGPLGVMDHWTFILGYDTWPEVLDCLPQEVDFIFLDTNHVYEETLLELELYYPRVRPGGRMLLHDTALETTGNAVTPQPPYPVLTAMTEFCEDRGLGWTNNPSCFGLGTIYC